VSANLTAVDVAAKVRHSSTNSQKDYATDNSERKANRMFAMMEKPTEKKRSSSAAKLEPIREDVIIVETQPMLPENRDKFLNASKKHRIDTSSKVNQQKESTETLEMDIELAKLEKENKILRLKKENQKMKEELTRSSEATHSPVPYRHRRSYPPTYREPSPFQERYNYSNHREEYRQSYPPTNYYPRNIPPPRHYEDRRGRHGGFDEDEFGSYPREYHRR